MQEPRHVTLVTLDRSGIAGDAADRVVGPLLTRRWPSCTPKQTSSSSSPRRGHVRAATRGFSLWRDVRRHAGDRPRGVHRPRLERARGGLGRPPRHRPSARLARARSPLLHFLRTNALETARGWPSAEQSSDFMASALLAIRRRPPPDATARTERLLNDVRAAIEGYRVQLQEREELEYAASVISWARAHPLARSVRLVRRQSGR